MKDKDFVIRDNGDQRTTNVSVSRDRESVTNCAYCGKNQVSRLGRDILNEFVGLCEDHKHLGISMGAGFQIIFWPSKDKQSND